MKAIDRDAVLEEWLSTDMSTFSADFSPQLTNIHDSSSPAIGPTISPQELFMNPPASTATINLASPLSLFDSPSDSYDTSPLFGADDISPEGQWYSLFPETNPDPEDSSVSPPMPNLSQPESHAHGESAAFTEEERAEESPCTSPLFRSTSSSATRRSATSGVRKRAPLPPIVVQDPSDTVAMKRARNTLAARKSRAKKMERMEEMEAEIESLKEQVEHWKDLALGRRRS